MSDRIYGNAIIERLEQGTPEDVRAAIDWLKANLTEAALHSCHHCGEAEREESPCWWCGLRDKPKRRRR